MYLGTATLRRFEADGRKIEDLPLVEWSMNYTFALIEEAFNGLYQNMTFPFRGLIRLWSRFNPIGTMPSDTIGSQVARILQIPGAQRDRLTAGIYIPDDKEQSIGRLENAFKLVFESELILKKISDAIRTGHLKKEDDLDTLISDAIITGIISKDEAQLVAEAEMAREFAIQVDSFTQDEYLNKTKLSTQAKQVA